VNNFSLVLSRQGRSTEALKASAAGNKPGVARSLPIPRQRPGRQGCGFVRYYSAIVWPVEQPMTNIALRPMTEDEVADFVTRAREGYESQLAQFGGQDALQARRKAEADHAQLFPDGRLSPGLHLFVAEDSGDPVGHLWLAEQARGAAPGTAYVYDVEVDQTQRGHGYGRAIMHAAEHWASTIGASHLALNVFGGNAVARSLYESLGYEVTAMQMRKPISRPEPS
jgi:GNAT superfamily N-acetyltransferase